MINIDILWILLCLCLFSLTRSQAQTYEILEMNSRMSDAQLLDRIETKGKLTCLQYPALGSAVDYHCLAQSDLDNYYFAKEKGELGDESIFLALRITSDYIFFECALFRLCTEQNISSAVADVLVEQNIILDYEKRENKQEFKIGQFGIQLESLEYCSKENTYNTIDEICVITQIGEFFNPRDGRIFIRMKRI